MWEMTLGRPVSYIHSILWTKSLTGDKIYNFRLRHLKNAI